MEWPRISRRIILLEEYSFVEQRLIESLTSLIVCLMFVSAINDHFLNDKVNKIVAIDVKQIFQEAHA